MKATYTLEKLPEIAKEVLASCKTKTLLFYGEMGAGKTTLIKELAKQLGVTDAVSSPTFSLVNEYQGKDSLIYHFDFYRIESEEEAYDIGFEEYLYSENWKFIEWPERILSLLPQEYDNIFITNFSTSTRTITTTNKEKKQSPQD